MRLFWNSLPFDPGAPNLVSSPDDFRRGQFSPLQKSNLEKNKRVGICPGWCRAVAGFRRGALQETPRVTCGSSCWRSGMQRLVGYQPRSKLGDASSTVPSVATPYRRSTRLSPLIRGRERVGSTVKSPLEARPQYDPAFFPSRYAGCNSNPWAAMPGRKV